MKLLIYGSGGSGRECMDIARRMNAVSGQWDELLFLDDFRQEASFYGARVLSFDALCAQYSPKQAEVVIAQGEPHARRMLREKTTAAGYPLANVIDPTACIFPSAIFGTGVIISPHCTVASDAIVGENVYLNIACVVHHDCTVGNDSVISPSVTLSGNVHIGIETYIGVGTTVKDSITIGSRTIIGAGSVVVRDIPDDVVAMGNPCKVTRANTDHRVFK